MSRRKRWLSRASVVLVLLIVGLVSGRSAAPAQALDVCKDAPEILRPDVGTAGWFLPKPDLATYPDRPADPWADTNAKFVDVYGTSASFFWYDLGCGPAQLTETPAIVNTQTAQLAYQDVNAWVAFLNSMEHSAKEMNLDWLSRAAGDVSAAVRTEALTKWLPLALVVAGLVIVWAARRQDYAQTAKNAGIVGVCLILAYLCLQVPTTVMQRGDDLVMKISRTADTNLSGSATDAVWRSSVLPMWTIATLGSKDSPTARDYAPRLWEATHYTWADIKQIDANPDSKEGIDEGKHERFKAAAAEIKEKDPAAYEHVRGTAGGRPLLQAYVQTALNSAFVAVAFLMVLLARFMAVAIVIMGMFAAIVGVIPAAKAHGMLRSLWDLFTANLIATFKFALAAKIVTMLMNAVVASNLNGGGKVLSMVLITVAAFVLTRPLRTFKTMVPGANPEQGFSMLKRGLATALGAAAGLRIGRRAKKDDEDDDDEDDDSAKDESSPQKPTVTRHSIDSMPALSPPPTTRSRVQLDRVDEEASAWRGVAKATDRRRSEPVSFTRVAGELPPAPDRAEPGEPKRGSRDTGGITPEEPKRWRMTSAGSIERDRDPQAEMDWWAPGGGATSPVVGEQVRPRGTAGALPPSTVVRPRPALTATAAARPESPRREAPTVSSQSTAAKPPTATPTAGSTRAMVNLRGEHLTSEQLRNVEVIEGEVIEDPTLYRSQKSSTVRSSEYVRLPEPVLGPDGTETRSVTYVSAKGGDAA